MNIEPSHVPLSCFHLITVYIDWLIESEMFLICWTCVCCYSGWKMWDLLRCSVDELYCTEVIQTLVRMRMYCFWALHSPVKSHRCWYRNWAEFIVKQHELTSSLALLFCVASRGVHPRKVMMQPPSSSPSPSFPFPLSSFASPFPSPPFPFPLLEVVPLKSS